MLSYENILAKAANLCSKSEKCAYDIKEKMLSWGLNETEAENALQYLIKNKYVDDIRFTRYFVRDKIKINRWGRIKIAYALRNKQIHNDIILSAVEEVDPEQFEEILDALIKSKMKSIGTLKKAADKAKLFRFAAQRGFTSEEIYRAIHRIESS